MKGSYIAEAKNPYFFEFNGNDAYIKIRFIIFAT